MIQGLRLLPFTADLPNFDCDKCLNGEKRNGQMITKPQHIEERRRQACGLLPRDPSVKRAWGVPLGVSFNPGEGEGDDFAPICPGYLTSLPEVQEAVTLRPQWLKGTLGLYLRDHDGNVEPALSAQAVLDGAVTTKQNYDMEKRAKEAKGGQ